MMTENESGGAAEALEKKAGKQAGQFDTFDDADGTTENRASKSIDFILDIPLTISAEVGRTRMLVEDLLALGQGSVIELGKTAGETLEILANDRLIARGEVVVVNEKYGIRITEIISPSDRIEKLG